MTIKNLYQTARKHHPVFRALTLLWLLFITLLCLLPQQELPQVEGIPHLDKLVHFGLYFIFSLFTLITVSDPGMKKQTAYLLAVFLFSLAIECLQAILPFGRFFSFN
ncbi:MAG: hypothetical protein AB7D05_04320, partial [Mangrovibacterium sp.]